MDEFSELVFTFIEEKKININAIIELIYSYFLYKKDGNDLSDIILVEGEISRVLSTILNQFKVVLKNKSIGDLTVRSLYYLCLAIGIIDVEIRDIIQQKILDLICELDDEELLEFLTHFKFKARENVYSLDILNDKNVFNHDIARTLKSKLLVLQNNEDIMQNSKYISIFSSSKDSPLKEDRSQHIVDYILQDLYKIKL